MATYWGHTSGDYVIYVRPTYTVNINCVNLFMAYSFVLLSGDMSCNDFYLSYKPFML